MKTCFHCRTSDQVTRISGIPGCFYDQCEGCYQKTYQPTTKIDKMRLLIRKELERSFIPGLVKQLNMVAPYIKKLNNNPSMIPGFMEEIIQLQLPYYMMVSDQVAEKAYEFFMTEEGQAWVKNAGEMNDKLMKITHPLVHDLVHRLDSLENN